MNRSLKTLNLRQNYVADAGATRLALMLSSAPHALQVLDVQVFFSPSGASKADSPAGAEERERVRAVKASNGVEERGKGKDGKRERGGMEGMQEGVAQGRVGPSQDWRGPRGPWQ